MVLLATTDYSEQSRIVVAIANESRVIVMKNRQTAKLEKQLIYLLLHNKECLRKFSQTKIEQWDFTDEHRGQIVEQILQAYNKHQVLLTRQQMLQNIETIPVPKQKIAVELAFNICYMSSTSPDNFPWLLEQLKTKIKENQITKALGRFKVDRDNAGTDVAVKNLRNDLQKIETETNDTGIEHELQQYKRFPASVLSKDIQAYCRAVSETMSVPPEWLAGSIMAVSSSLLGNKVTLDTGFGGHVARPYFSYIVVCPNGSNKTHPMLKVMSYIFDKDIAEKEKYMTAKKQYDNALYTARKNKQIFEAPAPVRKRHFVNDTTIEQLSKALNDNPQGLLWYVNEIAGLFTGLGQYKNNKGNDEQRFIDMLDGVNYSVIRGDTDISVNKPFVSALGTTQPAVIKSIMSKYKDNGLAYRFCYNYSPKNVYKVKVNPSTNIDGYLNSFFACLDSLPLMAYHLHFDLDAQQKAIDYINNNFADMQAQYTCPVISGIISKIRTQFVNFCLLLHCMQNHKDIAGNLTISSQTVEQAYRLTMYYMYHNYLTLATNDTAAPAKVLNDYDKVLNAVVNGSSTVRDIQTKTKIQSNRIRPILEQLENDGVGTCQVSEQGRNKGQVSGFIKKTA